MGASFLEPVYNPSLVALSVGVAMIASYVSLDVAARIWPARRWRRFAWITAAATAMGGGIWSMHFIAMLAFSLPLEVYYSLPVTLVSLLIAIAVTGVGFTIVSGGQGRVRLLLAGSVMGFGVAAMHYTGMSAMRLQAELIYTPWLFAASILIACAAATVALWVASRGGGRFWRIGAAVLMGLAVAGMHYTGMAAACFTPTATPLGVGDNDFEGGYLAWLIALGTLLILCLELASAAIDRRFSAFRLREAEILRLSARRFQQLIQSSNDLILVTDQAGRIDFAAASSRAAIGLDPAELEHRNIFDFVAGPGLETLRSVVTAQEAHAAFAFVDRLEIRDTRGVTRRYEATACNLLDEVSVKGIALTFHDVTEREKSAEELRQATRISDEANRMKSEFIANMSHELRTPLNAILGFSEIVALDGSGRIGVEKYREYCGDIHRSAQHLLSIINDILDLSKAEAAQLTLDEGIIDTATLIADTIRLVTPMAVAKRARIETRLAAPLPHLLGDERRLRQVLLNLLSNATKFSAGDSRIVIEAGMLASGELQFSVKDSGIGIPEDKLALVFEPFFQVDGSLARRHDGTGLGLAIARSLAELHGGRIELASTPGRGTTVRFILPARRVMGRAA